MEARVLFALLLGWWSGRCCSCLEITRLSVPGFVRNGSEESVLLDCEYSYSPKEDRKLVVKWFRGDDPLPVYQGIPELDSRLLASEEKFRLEEEEEEEEEGDPRGARAPLRIRRPTTELSGTYKCEVQSLGGSDARQDSMTVYALPTSVSLNYTIREEGVVRVVCEVDGVYPLPEVSLFQIKPRTVEATPLNDTALDYEMDEEGGGAYDLQFYTDIPEEDLSDGPTFFGCEVRMEGADYEKEVKVPFFPNPIAEKQEGDDDVDNQARAAATSFVLVLVALIVLLT